MANVTGAIHPERNNRRGAARPLGQLGSLLLAGVFLLSGCTESVPEPGIMPVLSINEVMVGLIDHASHQLWEAGLEDNAPQTSSDWQELEHHAIQLVSSGTLILMGGTGIGDPVWVQGDEWKGYSQAMINTGIDALAATRDQDLDRLLALGDQLVLHCESCHSIYKPDIPSEGVFHPH